MKIKHSWSTFSFVPKAKETLVMVHHGPLPQEPPYKGVMWF